MPLPQTRPSHLRCLMKLLRRFLSVNTVVLPRKMLVVRRSDGEVTHR
jgi:hypothetical protein